MKNSVKLSVSWHSGGRDSSFYTSVKAIAVLELHANDSIKIIDDRTSSMHFDIAMLQTIKFIRTHDFNWSDLY